MSANIRMTSAPRKAAAIIAAGVLAFTGTMVPFAPAHAEQTGTGKTDLVVKLKNGGNEVSGTVDPNNPDGDGDGLGDNIAFTVPTKINFVADSMGVLTGPTADTTYIENDSKFATHVSSMAIDEDENWNIVKAAAQSDKVNAIDVQIGPSGDSLDASEYLAKKQVRDMTKWNMSSAIASGTADRVLLATSGNINNVALDISNDTTFGTITWYVTPGTAR